MAFGDLRPGLQTGFCADTGGGWSTAPLDAHASQLHAVPESFTDDDAVMVEPTACAVHAVLSAGVDGDDVVAVIGAGTLGLACTAALHHLVRPGTACSVTVGAKHHHQRKEAEALGADVVVVPDQLARAVRRQSGSLVLAGRLTDGADVVFDCVGSSESLTQALAMVRPRGRVVLVGMPGRVAVDLAPLWHRELQLVGAYAYGTESARARRILPGPSGPGPSTWPSIWWPRPGSGRWCRPPTPWSATRRPSPMPAPPAAGARSRWSSTYATRKDAPDEPQARIRARRRPFHAAHPVLARGEVQLGAPARGQPGHLRPRAHRAAEGSVGGHPDRPGRTRWAISSPCRPPPRRT